MLCEMPRRPFLLAVFMRHKAVLFFQPSCKQWKCPACAQSNRKRWALRAHYGYTVLAADSCPLYFATVTSHEKIRTVAESQRVFRDAWPDLRKRMNRAAPGLAWFGIPEHHRDGVLHFHFITDAPLQERWLKDNARGVGFGYMADVELIQSAWRTAGYVLKYLGKDLGLLNWPKFYRRVRTSRNWPALPERELPPDVDIIKIPAHETLAEVVDTYRKRGYAISFVDHRTAWDNVDGIRVPEDEIP